MLMIPAGILLMIIGFAIFQLFDAEDRIWVVPVSRGILTLGSVITVLGFIRTIIALFKSF